MKDWFDPVAIRTWYAVEKNNSDLVEVRLIGSKTGSGYFHNIDNLINEVQKYPGYGVYVTINKIDECLYGRKQHEQILFDSRIPTTSDKDVVGRDALLIDIDSRRPSGTNATDSQVKKAKEVANKIYAFLKDSGWNAPIVSLSGNGVHLLYKIALANTAENTNLVKSVLEVLDFMFSTEDVDVDTTVFNPSRIKKLCGTRSAKGYDTDNQPQRMCEYVRIPIEWSVVEKEYLEKIAQMKPVPEEPTRFNNFDPQKFNLDDFLREHNIAVKKEINTPSHRKLILEECPFNSAHKAPDSALFVLPNGAIGFKCLHASCAHYGFRDFRQHFDPQAYDHRTYAEYRQKREYYSPYKRDSFVPKDENPADGKKWLSPTDVRFEVKPTPSIPTGYYELDKKTGGMLLGDVTVISGRNASGKSILLDNILMNVISRNYPTAVWSGELQKERFFDWLYLVAAGKQYNTLVDGYDNWYRTPKNIAEKIAKWMDGRMWLYNANYSNNWAQIFEDMKGCIKLHDPKLFVLDNLSALDLAELEGSQFERQKSFVGELKQFAKEKNVHVILVVHPRKTSLLLRKEDISGDANLTNLVDNVWLVHRTNRDFETRAKDFWKKDEVDRLMQYSTVIESAKNRHLGAEDFLLGLYYEHESKRLKTEIAENINYGIFEVPAPPPDPDPYDDIITPRDTAPF